LPLRVSVEDLLKPSWQHCPNSVNSLEAPLQVTVSHISMGQVLEVLKQVVLVTCGAGRCGGARSAQGPWLRRARLERQRGKGRLRQGCCHRRRAN
jgi:hypothetical protein